MSSDDDSESYLPDPPLDLLDGIPHDDEEEDALSHDVFLRDSADVASAEVLALPTAPPELPAPFGTPTVDVLMSPLVAGSPLAYVSARKKKEP